MAQHDYSIANQSGASFRSDLNNALSAIVSQNSGTAEPSTTYAYQMWADTTNGVMKLRNAANSAWITLYQLDGEWSVIPFENGSAAAPSIYFKDSGTDTGFFSAGTDQVNVTTGGTERVEWGTSEVVFNDSGANYDFRVEGDNNANLLFVDASADAVGIGTSSPGVELDVNGTIRSRSTFRLYSSSNDIFYIAPGTVITGGTANDIALRSDATGSILFSTNGATERMRIDSSGRVGIGTTSPGATLETASANVSGDDNLGNVYIRTTDAQGSNIGGKLTLGGLYNASATYAFAGIAGRKENATSNNVAGYLQFLTTTSAGALSERARIDSSGRLLVGTSSDSKSSTLVIQGNSGNTSNHGVFRIRRGSANPTAGTDVGSIVFEDSNGGIAAEIDCLSDGTWGTNDYPGRLVFSTTADGASSPTERMRISQNGNISIGTTNNTTARVRIDGDGVLTGFRAQAATATTTVYAGSFRHESTTSGAYIQFLTDGEVETGRIYDSAGTMQYASSSDRRLKTNIQPLQDGLSKVLALEPCTFDMRRGEDHIASAGLIAQDVYEIYPFAVGVGGEDENTNPWSVDYGKLTPLLIHAIQQQQEMIAELQDRLSALEGA